MSTQFKYEKSHTKHYHPLWNDPPSNLSLDETCEWGEIPKESALNKDLENWYEKAHVKPVKITVEVRASGAAVSSEFDKAVLFNQLARQWKIDTWHISSVRRRISHPSYLKIIGMGEEALSLIFADMRKQPSHWFWALEAITREENIAPGATSLGEVHKAWLEWANANGY
jgi:hypothetical protein